MRKFFLYQTIFFLIISTTGVALSLYFLRDTSDRLQEIQTALISMSQRAKLYREVEALDPEVLNYPKINRLLKDCRQCHTSEEHIKGVSNIELAFSELQKAQERNAPEGLLLEHLHKLVRDAALKGETHLLEETSQVSSLLKKWTLLMVSSLLVLFGGLIVLSFFMQRRLSRYTEEIIKATKAISEGKNPSIAPFSDEFRPIGDALRRMQAQIKASEEKLLNWAEAWQKTFDTIGEMIAACD